ncbi:hypothetical protein NKJ89_06260 [Mesorhizobium sp. M0047]
MLSVWFVASGKRYEFEDVPPEETLCCISSRFRQGSLL